MLGFILIRSFLCFLTRLTLALVLAVTLHVLLTSSISDDLFGTLQLLWCRELLLFGLLVTCLM